MEKTFHDILSAIYPALMPILAAARLSDGDGGGVSPGRWTRCPGCEAIVDDLELQREYWVCPRCDHHFVLTARERLSITVDCGTFEEFDSDIRAVDILNSAWQTSYTDRLIKYRKVTEVKDAVVCGFGKVDGRRVCVSVMDFHFLAATMGSVVGEKIARAVERATAENVPKIIICASGGARIYEGVLSLMQMAKTCGALARHAQAGLPYISILTDPTAAAVLASFASIGDVILAEPRSMIGFSGSRVIRERACQQLPPAFQTAEFCMSHGLVDMVVDRRRIRATLASLMGHLSKSFGR